MFLYFSLIVLLIGVLVYLGANDPKHAKLAEVGRLMFAIGLLAFLLIAVGAKGVGLG